MYQPDKLKMEQSSCRPSPMRRYKELSASMGMICPLPVDPVHISDFSLMADSDWAFDQLDCQSIQYPPQAWLPHAKSERIQSDCAYHTDVTGEGYSTDASYHQGSARYCHSQPSGFNTFESAESLDLRAFESAVSRGPTVLSPPPPPTPLPQLISDIYGTRKSV